MCKSNNQITRIINRQNDLLLVILPADYILLMQKSIEDTNPIVYSCSGCSGAAQMANAIALKIDRSGLAEMSCIAGVGGNVKKLVRLAKSGRKLIAIDGCPLACSRACLANHQLKPDLHFDLSDFGVLKGNGQDVDQMQMLAIFEQMQDLIQQSVATKLVASEEDKSS